MMLETGCGLGQMKNLTVMMKLYIRGGLGLNRYYSYRGKYSIYILEMIDNCL